MKVLHVIESLGRGGAEQLLATMLPELQRQGVTCLLAVRAGAMDLEPELSNSGVRVTRLSQRHRWNLEGAADEIAELCKSENVDIVHAHLYFPMAAVALARYRRKLSAKTCVTFHNLAYSGANPRTVKLELRRRLARWLCARGVDKFLAVSGAAADHYRKALNLSTILVVPNAIDLSGMASLLEESLPSSAVGSECRIVLPGRIVREKGHADLVEALSILKTRGFEPHVTLAGDGPLRPEIESLVSSRGLAKVQFAGSLPHEAMLRAIATADMVVVPSRFEGFGITALEGMSLGRAVIASRAGGLPETLGGAGMLVDVRDPLGIADALEQLMLDPAKRAELGAAARERANAFNLPDVAAALAAIYTELCREAAPPPKR